MFKLYRVLKTSFQIYCNNAVLNFNFAIFVFWLLDSNTSESNGTVIEEVSEEKRKECCISEETAISLGKLSLKV